MCLLCKRQWLFSQLPRRWSIIICACGGAIGCVAVGLGCRIRARWEFEVGGKGWGSGTRTPEMACVAWASRDSSACFFSLKARAESRFFRNALAEFLPLPGKSQ